MENFKHVQERLSEILLAFKSVGLTEEDLADIHFVLQAYDELSDSEKTALAGLYNELKNKVQELGL